MYNHQSPITNHQSPITNHQSPITRAVKGFCFIGIAWLLFSCGFIEDAIEEPIKESIKKPIDEGIKKPINQFVENIIGRLDISKAQSLAVVPAKSVQDIDSSSVADSERKTNPQDVPGPHQQTPEKVLVKIQADGTMVKVPMYNKEDQKLEFPPSPNQIIHANDNYLMMELGNWYLVRKSDGAAFDLNNVHPDFHNSWGQYSNYGNSPKVYSDDDDNIYFSSNSYNSNGSGRVVEKIDISNPAAPTAQKWTPDIYDVHQFVVDSAGNTLFRYGDYNDPSRRVKITESKTLQNIPFNNSHSSHNTFMYRGLDGRIYYLTKEQKTTRDAWGNQYFSGWEYKQKFLSKIANADGDLESTAYGPAMNDKEVPRYNENDFDYDLVFIYLADRIVGVNADSHGSDLGSPIEFYKTGGNPAGKQTIAGLSGKKLKTRQNDMSFNPVQVGKNSYYVLTVKDGVYRVDSSYTATQIFGSSEYDVYKMAVSSDAQGNDTVIFNAFQFKGSKKITGRVTITSSGTKGEVELIEELDGVELTILQRVN